MIKAIIFDLWNTLGGKHTSVSRVLFSHFGILNRPATNVQYERSVQLKKWKTKKTMAKGFLRAFGLAITASNTAFVQKAFDHAIQEAMPFPGMKQLLFELNSHYKIAMLSNTTNFESAVPTRWGFDGIFDAEVYSWQVGAIKPARKNFEAAAKRLQARMDECLFIDDNIINVRAAKRYGMKAIHFKDVAQLKRELGKLSIKF